MSGESLAVIDYERGFFRLYIPEYRSWHLAAEDMGLHKRKGIWCIAEKDINTLRTVNKTFVPRPTAAAQDAVSRLKSQKHCAVSIQELNDSYGDLLHTAPRIYQWRCLQLLHEFPYYGLFLDPGLGKTKVTLDDFVIKGHDNKVDKAMIFCPGYLQDTWAEEVQKHHPGLDFTLVRGSKRSKIKKLQRDTPVYIIGLEGLIAPKLRGKDRDASFIEAIKEKLATGRWLGAVDESTLIKSPTTNRTKACIHLRQYFQYRRILTGTPVPRDIRDIWSQLSFLDERATGFPTYRGFESYHCCFAPPPRHYIMISTMYEDELQKTMDKWSIRLKLDDQLDLPEKIYKKIEFDLPRDLEKKYRELEELCFTELKDKNGEELLLMKSHILAKTETLSQLAKGFVMWDRIDKDGIFQRDLHVIHKFRVELLKEIIETEYNGLPTVIWERHIVGRQMICDNIPSAIDLTKHKGAKMAPVIKKFREGKLKGPLILSPFAHSKGLNLQFVKIHIFYSNFWNWEQRVQAEGRTYRSGLNHRAIYLDFIARNTVDEVILDNLKTKDEFALKFVDSLREMRKDV